MWRCPRMCSFFFFNDTATTEIYTLSLHDALPIYQDDHGEDKGGQEQAERHPGDPGADEDPHRPRRVRSEEHTSELQSHLNLVCRLLLEKKKQQTTQSSICIRRNTTWSGR